MTSSHSKFANVIRVTSGNFIEMYDFFLFGFYATYISKAFFPSSSEQAGLMLVFATFGAGFYASFGCHFLGWIHRPHRSAKGIDSDFGHHGNGNGNGGVHSKL